VHCRHSYTHSGGSGYGLLILFHYTYVMSVFSPWFLAISRRKMYILLEGVKGGGAMHEGVRGTEPIPYQLPNTFSTSYL